VLTACARHEQHDFHGFHVAEQFQVVLHRKKDLDFEGYSKFGRWGLDVDYFVVRIEIYRW
jgi:hypothetical protein